MNDRIVELTISFGFIFEKYSLYNETYYFKTKKGENLTIQIEEVEWNKKIYLNFKKKGKISEKLLLKLNDALVEEIKKGPRYRLKFAFGELEGSSHIENNYLKKNVKKRRKK
jgi:hypothetical protein